MNHPINPPHKIINHGLLKQKPQTQFAYVFLFLAAPAILACAAAFLHLTKHDVTQVYQMLWLCFSLLVPSFFAGLSFWLLAHNGKHAKASLLTCVSYAIVAALIFIILMNVQDRSYKADAFFLLGILVFGFLITVMTAIILSIVPHVRYGKLALFIFIVLLGALFLPVKQAMQGVVGDAAIQGTPPAGHGQTKEMQKIQNAIAYAFKQNVFDVATLCQTASPPNPAKANASSTQSNQPAALVVGRTAEEVCIPMRYANIETFNRLNPDCCTITITITSPTAGTGTGTTTTNAPAQDGLERVLIEYKYNELNQQQTATYVVELNKQGTPTRGFIRAEWMI